MRMLATIPIDMALCGLILIGVWIVVVLGWYWKNLGG